MGKGDKTRQDILEKVAVLFNEKGYAATSMQDITAATGIQRGGIYNHFASKEALALASFEYTCSILAKRLMRGVCAQKTAVGRLKAIASGFADLYRQNPDFPCGCQVLNTAVEAKRQMLTLRQRAQEAMNQLKALIKKTILQGIERVELQHTADPDAVTAVMISALEGAMLLSVLYDDTTYLDHAVNHLHWYVDTLAIQLSPSLAATAE